MIKISQELRAQFEALLAQKEIPKRLHSEYLKWLRYYLDFCHKYGFENSKKQGLSHFIEKLQDKRQTSLQQKSATLAISIYCEIKSSKTDHAIALGKNDRTSSPSKELLKPTHADWTSFYDNLDAEIKLRHYSPKTLRAYKGWVGQLQGFTRSKDPRLLSGSDIKNFLTHLAVN